VLAGAFPEELIEGSALKKQAESTYITNLRIAAEDCAKVNVLTYTNTRLVNCNYSYIEVRSHGV